MISPLLGLLLGIAADAGGVVDLLPLLARGAWIRVFRRLQLVSSALYSMGHGSNDAQKTMGIIWLLLIGAGITTQDHLPFWVVVSCYARHRASARSSAAGAS